MSHAHGQATAPRSKIEGSWCGRLLRQALEKLPGPLRKHFGLWTRNQHGSVDQDFQAAEGSGADNVLQRFAAGTPLDQLPDRIQLDWGKLAFKIQVEFQAGHTQGM